MAKIVQTEGRTSSLLECYAEVQPIFCKDTKKIETTIPFNSIFLFSTQRLSIRQPPNYLPTEATEPTEVSGARYSPTDCTDIHRLGGYGILPYPRSHKTIFPQNPTQPNHLCASVKSVGGSSPPEDSVYSVKSVGGSSPPEASVYSVKSVGEYPPPEASVYSVKSVGEYPPLETSVNSVNSVGGLAQANLEWVLWKEFGGLRGYGRDAIPSYICAICGRIFPT